MTPAQRMDQEETESPDLLVMDEDEQDRLIQQIQLENSQQQAKMDRIFGYICVTGAVFSLLVGLFVELRQMSRHHSADVRVANGMHVCLSVVLHINSCAFLKQDASQFAKVFIPMGINALLTVVGLFLARRRQDDDRLHVHHSLLVGNLIVIAMGLWLRREQRLTLGSIHDLQSAKYHFKSL